MRFCIVTCTTLSLLAISGCALSQVTPEGNQVQLTNSMDNVLSPSGAVAAPPPPGGDSEELINAVKSGQDKEARRLIKSGADINAHDASGITPLHIAAATGQLEMVMLFISDGVKIDPRSNEGVTPLYLAARNDHPSISLLLIDNGANVNARTQSGYTPLLIASIEGHLDEVKMLLEHHADVNAKDDKKNMTPLLWISEGLMRYYFVTAPTPAALIARKENPPLEPTQMELMHRVKPEWEKEAMLLIDHGADVNVMTDGCDSPLALATFTGDEALVKTLISHGASLQRPTCAKESLLHTAIAEGHREVAEILINTGINVNERNISQRTPLHFLAFYMDEPKLAELMIQHGADINAKDKDGYTALEVAEQAGHKEVAEVLRKHGGV